MRKIEDSIGLRRLKAVAALMPSPPGDVHSRGAGTIRGGPASRSRRFGNSMPEAGSRLAGKHRPAPFRRPHRGQLSPRFSPYLGTERPVFPPDDIHMNF
jgi:hypothetical protein